MISDLSSRVKLQTRQQLTLGAWIVRGLTLLAAFWLMVVVLLPLYEIVKRSVQDDDGNFVGLNNYRTYIETPNLAESFVNSVEVSAYSTLITVSIAFVYAYALTRTQMPFKSVFRILATLPLFAPSLLHGIAFVYLFGKQGIITRGQIGPDFVFKEQFGIGFTYDIGVYQKALPIILAECFYLFPHALLILIISLSLTDGRLYEAAEALGTSKLRTFLTVTLPSVKYGLISAIFVCFVLVITDFGIPKVLDGPDLMAIDIYQYVSSGIPNFPMAATVSMLLIIPAVLGFIIDRYAQRRQSATLSSRSVPYQPKPNLMLDAGMFIFCTFVASAILIVILTAFMASVVKVWPYNLEFTWEHYDYSQVAGAGTDVDPFVNSLRMATFTALFGTSIIFISAYLIEKGKTLPQLRVLMYFLSTLPVALPGLVLGLAYIFFFNNPDNPFHFIYNTMTILVVSTIVHFYTVSFFTATTALKQIDNEFESVSDSLSVPFYKTFLRVTVPISMPAILEIAMYYFVNAMTTVSAVIFLWSGGTELASVQVVRMEDAGDRASAAALSMQIFATGLGVWAAYQILTFGIRQRTQRWRQR